MLAGADNVHGGLGSSMLPALTRPAERSSTCDEGPDVVIRCVRVRN